MTLKIESPAAVAGESLRLYVPALDGLRFFAFLLVLIHHMPFEQQGLIMFIYQRGWVGVELFFAISSFLFFSLFKAEATATGKIDLFKFYVRRVLRLYPLMVAFPAIMMLAYGELTQAAISRFLGITCLVDNFLASTLGYNIAIPFSAHLWTLSYEFQLYLVLPIAFLLYQSLGRRHFLWLLLIIWLVACGARLAFILAGMPYRFIWLTPFLRPESTLLGIALALGVFSRLSPLMVAGVAIGAVLLFAQMPELGVVDIWTLAVYPVVALLCGAVLWFATNSRLASLLGSAVLVYLGKISFGLYVFHFYAGSLAQQLMVFANVPEHSTIGNYVLRVAIVLVVTVALSSASYFLFERMFLKLKARFSAIESRPV